MYVPFIHTLHIRIHSYSYIPWPLYRLLNHLLKHHIYIIHALIISSHCTHIHDIHISRSYTRITRSLIPLLMYTHFMHLSPVRTYTCITMHIYTYLHHINCHNLFRGRYSRVDTTTI